MCLQTPPLLAARDSQLISIVLCCLDTSSSSEEAFLILLASSVPSWHRLCWTCIINLLVKYDPVERDALTILAPIQLRAGSLWILWETIEIVVLPFIIGEMVAGCVEVSSVSRPAPVAQSSGLQNSLAKNSSTAIHRMWDGWGLWGRRFRPRNRSCCSAF